MKNEASRTSTVKVGNKTGYTEYYKHERVREVDFGPSYQSVKNSGGNSSNQLTYDHGGYYSDDDYWVCLMFMVLWLLSSIFSVGGLWVVLSLFYFGVF